MLLDYVVFAAVFESTCRGVEAAGIRAISVASIDDLVGIHLGLIMEDGAAGLGLAGIRVPVEVRSNIPVTIKAIQAGQGIRRTPAVIVGVLEAGIELQVLLGQTWQLHATITEIINLSRTHYGPFKAIRLNETRSYAQGKLVGVAYPVTSRETIFAPQ
ncbi:Uncharacterised protein [Acinetobacter baumannii]|nr:Uncharacterised protein [Acinetobacter baumannii]